MRNTTLCYIEQGGSYLMLHRTKKENDQSHDKWLGIGGKFEDKESPEECILRETREETGFTLQNPAYRGIVDFYAPPWPSERMHLFTCTDFCGEPIDCNEGTLEWVPKADVLQLPIWQGDKLFFQLLNDNAPFFHLELYYDGDTLTRAVLDSTELPL